MAHEDDPERAARAGLRILEVAREYARDVEGAWGIKEFDVRVGINSGQTGVGMVGSAAPQAVALGDATNVAARLQGAADPGTIAVGPETARRLAGGFVLESLGALTVKGRTDPVAAWRLVGPRPGGDGGPLARYDTTTFAMYRSSWCRVPSGFSPVLFELSDQAG